MGRTAFVTGATGFIGRRLVRQLIAEGWKVRALVREGAAPGDLPREATVCRGSLTDSSALRAAAAGCEVVFHLAAKLHVNDPPPEAQQEYHAVNLEGTARVAEAAQAAGARRMVFFSTINVYGGSRPGEILDETSPLRPDSFYAATKVQAEEIARGTLPAVVLRLAAVYGPEMKGNYPRMLRMIRRGRFVFVGDGSNRRTLVHVGDACSAAILAAVHPRAVGQVYNVSDGRIHTLRQIVEAIAAALGRRPPRLRVPLGPARLAAAVLEQASRCLGKRLPLRALVDKITEDMAVRGEKLLRELEFRPKYGLVAGWQDAITGFPPCSSAPEAQERKAA